MRILCGSIWAHRGMQTRPRASAIGRFWISEISPWPRKPMGANRPSRTSAAGIPGFGSGASLGSEFVGEVISLGRDRILPRFSGISAVESLKGR
eukprot:511407-Pyramimonas_sp.AAC.1